MGELVLHVQNIDEAGKDFAFELTPLWLNTVLSDVGLRADTARGAGSLRGHVQQNGVEYLVHAQLRADLITECGRCLGDTRVPIDVEVATLFARVSSKGAPSAQELAEEDQEREEFVGQDIVLDAWVREHLVIEVPMQALCSADCRGIPVPERVRPPEHLFPSSGGVDPRLAPLQRLRDNVPAVREPKPKSSKAPKAHKE
jgi:uncharacterized protein